MFPVLWNVVLTILLIKRVDNKAMMIEPPHRSSLWRYDKLVPVNTKDDMLNCGGYEVQWEQNGGMCGVCGQPFNGVYADVTDYTIVRSYNQGAYVNVTVEVKSNLLGYFEFRLCPRNGSRETLTHECFERNMLWIEESWSTRYYVGSHGGIYDLHVRLPADKYCSHCVFQWKFSTGYRMGGINECECMGCGRQETFFNCADIEILPDKFLSQRGFVSTEINIHKPLFLISHKNLTDSGIELLRNTLPIFESPRVPEIRKSSSSPSNEKKTYRNHVNKSLLGHSKKKQFENLAKDFQGVKVKPLNFNRTKLSSGPFSWQHASSSVIFKANLSFPLKISTRDIRKKSDKTTLSFWDKISRKAKHSKFWDTLTRNPKQASFWERISATSPKIFIKPKPVDMGKRQPPTYTPNAIQSPRRMFYPSVSGTDAMTYPLFQLPQHSTAAKNGDCYPSSSNYRCRGKGQYAHTRGIDQWCISNCKSNHCVKFMCDCGCDDNVIQESKCHAVGPFEDIHGMDEWCSQICSREPCPSNVCSVKDCQNGS